MTVSIKTQAAINNVYRDALVEVLTATNKPLDREELNMQLLGGIEPVEVLRLTVEPYIPALAQLVLEGKVVQYQEGCRDGGNILFALRCRVSNEEKANCDMLLEQQDGKDRDWNDPSNWRRDLDDATECVNAFKQNIILEFLSESSPEDLEAIISLQKAIQDDVYPVMYLH
jgi:hypothetical protein